MAMHWSGTAILALMSATKCQYRNSVAATHYTCVKQSNCTLQNSSTSLQSGNTVFYIKHTASIQTIWYKAIKHVRIALHNE